MRLFIIAMMAIACACNTKTASTISTTNTATTQANNNMLLGKQPKQALQQVPYKEWFDQNYNSYALDSSTIPSLQSLAKGKRFEIFMGTWCGDSKREVPRMLKVLEAAGVVKENIQLIMVDNADSAYKQSPQREDKNKHVFRVPTLLVYEKGKEKGRIIESPKQSIEKDLGEILSGKFYEPHYKAGSLLISLLDTRSVDVMENDISNTANTLKPFVSGAHELNAYGYILLADRQYRKASIVFNVNSMLYPHNLVIREKLAYAYWKSNNNYAAEKCCKIILEQQPQNPAALQILAAISK